MNHIYLTGNLTRDVVKMTSKKGTIYIRGNIAVRKNYGEGANFIDFKIFGNGALTFGKYTKKGSKVAINGEMEIRKVNTNGEWKVYADVMVRDFEFLGTKPKSDFDKQEKEWEPPTDEYVRPPESIRATASDIETNETEDETDWVSETDDENVDWESIEF